MLLRVLFALSLVAAVLAACSSGPPTAGQETAFASVCDEANDGERVAVEGYLRLPESFTGEQSVILQLHESDAFAGPFIGVQTPIGSEANQMEQVPVSYTDNDLQVHLSDGQMSGYGEKVKVSGSVYFPLVDQEFDCGLENPLIEAAS